MSLRYKRIKTKLQNQIKDNALVDSEPYVKLAFDQHTAKAETTDLKQNDVLVHATISFGQSTRIVLGMQTTMAAGLISCDIYTRLDSVSENRGLEEAGAIRNFYAALDKQSFNVGKDSNGDAVNHLVRYDAPIGPERIEDKQRGTSLVQVRIPFEIEDILGVIG